MVWIASLFVGFIWFAAALGVLGLSSIAGDIVEDELDIPHRLWIDAALALFIIMSLSLPPLVVVVLLRIP